jgi:sugar lactone lactonase YvrE
MKIYTPIRKITFLLALVPVPVKSLAQVPNISYSSPQNYTVGITINPLSPANTGGAVPATPYGQVTTIAGNNEGYTEGMGAAASFHTPVGLAVDAAGNLYISDYYNHCIRKMTPAGLVSTFAGHGTYGETDAVGTAASFQYPGGIATDPTGTLYVADEGNFKIRKISSAQVVTTLAGDEYGDEDGVGTLARFADPVEVEPDADGNIYVCDFYNNKIRKVTPAGVVTTFAGTGLVGAVDGPGNLASFNEPWGLAIDTAGNVYVADRRNRKIRKITPAGEVSTFAGNGTYGTTDGVGTAASFANVSKIVFDAAGNLYVADSGNHKIRKITPAGVVTTFAGSGIQGRADGPRSTATFNFPGALALDTSGNLYVADIASNIIRKITTGGYSISPGLPSGLNFDSATGIISGTPLVDSPPVTYTITAYNTSGESTTTIVIGIVGLGTADFEKNNITVYPNPVVSQACIQLSDENVIVDKIMVIDMTGKILLEQAPNMNQINLENLAAGIYILEAFSGDKKQQVKFVKE